MLTVENLREYGIRAYCPDEGKEDELEKGDVQVVCGGLRQGYVYPEIRYVLLTERDMFGTRGNERRRRLAARFDGALSRGLKARGKGLLPERVDRATGRSRENGARRADCSRVGLGRQP